MVELPDGIHIWDHHELHHSHRPLQDQHQHQHRHRHLGTNDMLDTGMSAGMYADMDPIERSVGVERG